MKAVKGLFPTKPDTGTQTKKQPVINKINILVHSEKQISQSTSHRISNDFKTQAPNNKISSQNVKYGYLCLLTGKPRFLNISYHKDLDLKHDYFQLLCLSPTDMPLS